MARYSLTPLRSGAMSNDPFQSFQRGMNRLFEDVFQGVPMSVGGDLEQNGGVLMPQINVSETDKEIMITAELPGVAEKDVDVTLDDDMLTISGEKRLEKKEEKENYHFVERSFGRFQRSLRIPHSVNPDQVKAQVENGVLTITMPKNAEQERVRHIQIEGSKH
ncbi:Heat shock protein Hsp20 [Candidatus Filomicrobium marinum]|uniref:Heat shock protein Hsp20 n=2 Tax=Filomicrobium TaxID=119044 RepID=A0A0D6JF59_9HYPH|nr:MULTISPECIES: Hsp20/alpha crystallin family protein [Filomicrobium]MCV0370170.1 Hsp20/alpha crystallin family protein [Filomicrobium sp.]CFX25194.1 Heat shock protein Hsp20 [Candidatus Filomicrobium marinum]CPR19263.1 Heat shock protein Hsp20 [Candidatus Filomicrobium marinum]SDO09839.1 HSP20 family protein [Filomicrobium insigne]